MENTSHAAKLKELLAQKDAQSASAAQADGVGSARQLITSLLDAGSFAEIGAYVKRKSDENEFEGVLCGYGAIDSRLVFVFAQDIYRMKGAFDAYQAEKICNLYKLALQSGAPVIGVFNSAGALLEEGVDALSAYGRVMKAVSDASGVIPQIAYINGICAGSSAVIAAMFDITVSVKDVGGIYIAPKNVVGKTTAPAETGLVSKVYENEAGAIAGLRALFGCLPQNNQEGTVCDAASDEVNRAVDLSMTAQDGYDMTAVIAALADNGVFTEVSDHFAKEAVCGFAALGGTVCGVAANQPKDNGGKLTAAAAKKLAKFISLCDAFSIPVVTLADSEGAEYSAENENAPFASELAKLAFAYSTATVPKVTAVIGCAYGSAFTLMGSKSVGADVALALENAKISPLSPARAVAFLCNEKVADKDRAKVEADWAAQNATVEAAAAHGEIDDVIEASALRKYLCASLYMLASKANGTPERKHAVLPL
ncbi:MAG: hypothetical protein IJU41_01415 [Clostridia bacterium]|nr:hypothetical protein [Clostridia bacterium]